MASSNENYYDIKRLHVVFAVSAMALLATTTWMVMADHWRPWKVYQRTFRDRIEPWMTAAETASATDQTPPRDFVETTGKEDSSRQSVTKRLAAIEQFDRALARERPGLSKAVRRLPFVDALGKSLAIEQFWLPDLTINYNFRQVARFDRCTTCHQGIDKLRPDEPLTPAYPAEEILRVSLPTPKQAPQIEEDAEGRKIEPSLAGVYGFSLAPYGILKPAAVTIGPVLPRTAAANAGLRAGNVILRINETDAANCENARSLLLGAVPWGKPARLEIRRGLPHPYSTHPRLDLFVGSNSPHPVGRFGCTICHDGLGGATDFNSASHSPNDLIERARWRNEYGWSWNEHWDFPMRPARFAQSNCLKCHPEVSELEPTPRFPDSPADKLLAGYHLVRRNGCFGCHEIRGVTDGGERLGVNMRLEPNYHEAALGLLSDAALSAEESALARQIAVRPEDAPARRELIESLRGREGDGALNVVRRSASHFTTRSVVPHKEKMGTGDSPWRDPRGSTHGAAEPVPIFSQARRDNGTVPSAPPAGVATPARPVGVGHRTPRNHAQDRAEPARRGGKTRRGGDRILGFRSFRFPTRESHAAPVWHA